MFLIVLVFAGIVAWRIGERLSSDAISMGLGLLFGILAGVPTALLVMLGGRRSEPQPLPKADYKPVPPTIILLKGDTHYERETHVIDYADYLEHVDGQRNASQGQGHRPARNVGANLPAPRHEGW